MTLDVVTRYHDAVAVQDVDGARKLLHDELRFTGPFESFGSADEYVAAIQKLWGIVESIQVLHVSAAGDEVVAIYDMVTTTPAGTQPICEWYGVDGGAIAWIRAIFDTGPFAFLRSGQ
jgi:SnoaL-like domain